MYNVLFITGQMNVAGTETFMLNVVRLSDPNLYHYDFLTTGPNADNAYIQELKQKRCDFYYTVSRKQSFFQYHRQLYAFFKNNHGKYNAIHWCGCNLSSIAQLIYACIFKVPVRIIHSHNSSCYGLHNKVLHNINKHFAPLLCTDFLACSTKAAKFFFGDKKTIIIKNGVDIDRYGYSVIKRNAIRRKLNIAPDSFVIGHVGRFTKVKNHEFLISLFCSYLNMNPNAILLLVGVGELFDEMVSLVASLGITDKVLFLGLRNDIPDLMLAMDIFVMPSLFEGLPFVLVEAQSSSLPCVVSSTINVDAKITPFLYFENLNSPMELWIKRLDYISHCDRVDNSHYVIDSGYSMKDEVQVLYTLYTRLKH